ncbi:MAG: cyanoexosortase A [Anaerolineae bacterium]|nr:cyanoexosortase A [Gloeobacterales cyanobacterium ES-bin-313]
MESVSLDFSKRLTDQRFWLAALGAALAGFHLQALWTATDGNSEALVTQVLFWLAIGSLLWSRKETLRLESQPLPSAIGLVLIGLVLLKGGGTFLNPFAQFAPFVSALALALLASGLGGLKQYVKELALAATLVSTVLWENALSLKAIAQVTAKLAYAFLWYTGFDVHISGTNIMLPTGAVDVYEGCSGFHGMAQLFKLSILFLLTFETKGWIRKVITPLIAVAIAFFTNAIRVALMAILVAGGDKNAFFYWHEGEGSNIFSLVSMLLFGLFCYTQMASEDEPDEPDEPGTPAELPVQESQSV